MSAPVSAPAAIEYPEKIDGAVLKVAGVVVLGAIMSILDITVVNVALPTFQKVFAPEGGDPLAYSTVAWTVTAYTLALATVIPLTGWAADRFGTKRLYLLSIALFMGGSALAGLAWSDTSLIAFRVLQGLGGGMIMPAGMTLLTQAAGPARVGRVMAIVGVPMMIVNYRFHEGDNGPFVSAVGITKNPVTVEGIETSKVVINDGSTGIFSQLQNIELQRVADGTDEIRPLYCPKGLRKSEYERKDADGAPILNERTGKPERATTYYLA